MKTEQEQIEKIARIMCGYCSTDGKCAVSKNLREPDVCANVDTEHCLYKEYAERLFENGCYGNVSEYKAEIERLKADNEALQPKKKYENIDDIVRGFIVKDGKILYVTNILNGCRQEFKDIHRICDELNNNMKEIDSLMECNNYLRFQLEECKKLTAKEFAEKLKEQMGERDYMGVKYKQGVFSENDIDELLKEIENGQ